MSFDAEIEFSEIECQKFCVKVADGTHESPKQTPVGKRLATSKNIKDGQLNLDSAYLISLEDFDGINRRSKVEQWDILISMIGTVGEVCLVDTHAPDFAIKNVGLLKCKDKVHAKWLYYFFRSSTGKQLVEERKKGTTQQYISLGEIRRLPVSVPSKFSYMTKATEILSVLDDRITLLRETNATLEAIAQALFKSWFVDFDPVHAKAQGIAPEGMDEATAALFPDSFEESELGLVPKGWRVKALDEVADYLNGLALQKFPPDDDEGLPVIKIAQLRKGDTVGADRASRKMKQEYIIQNGDVLFSWSGSLEVEVWCGGEGALNQHLFKVTSNTYPKWFYYLWTKYHLESFRQTAASKATTMGHIQRVHLSQAKVIAPSDEFVSSADKYFAPILDRWIANALQVQTLATLRDTLLPRLISGQLRLSDTADIITETLSGI